MRTRGTRAAVAALFVLALGVMVGPAGAVEDGLVGARIGASYREIMRRFHDPDGVLIAAGGAISYQATPKVRISSTGSASLPPLNTLQPGTTGVPVWVEPVRVSFLADQQAEWVYDLRKARGITLGIVLSGEGADAVVTDVVVAGYPDYLKGKKPGVRTEKGVILQSTYRTVLEKYGFPPMVEVFLPGSTPPVTAGGGGGRLTAGVGGAGRAGGGRGMGGGGRGMGGGGRGMGGGGMGGGRGMGAGGGMGGGRGMGGGGGVGAGRGMGGRGGRGAAAPATTRALAVATPSYTVELTQMRGGGMGGRGGGRGMGGGGQGMGGRGMGARGGGMGGRGMGARGGGMGGRGGGGRGALPPAGSAATTAAAAAAAKLMSTAAVNNQAVSFSRDCVLSYEGIAFTLHDMRVMRIHVSE